MAKKPATARSPARTSPTDRLPHARVQACRKPGWQRFCVEFDGFLHVPPTDWQQNRPFDPRPHGTPAPGSLDLCQRIADAGGHLIVYSPRATCHDGMLGIQDWLKKHHFPEMQIASYVPDDCWFLSVRAIGRLAIDSLTPPLAYPSEWNAVLPPEVTNNA